VKSSACKKVITGRFSVEVFCATERQVSGRRVLRVLRSSGATISIAIGLVAKVASALLHPVRIFLPDIAFIPECARPFPRVADDVVKIEIILAVLVDGASRDFAIFNSVLVGELALPDVHPMLVVRHQLVAPWEKFSFLATSTRRLPLSLARQSFALELAIRTCIVP